MKELMVIQNCAGTAYQKTPFRFWNMVQENPDVKEFTVVLRGSAWREFPNYAVSLRRCLVSLAKGLDVSIIFAVEL